MSLSAEQLASSITTTFRETFKRVGLVACKLVDGALVPAEAEFDKLAEVYGEEWARVILAAVEVSTFLDRKP